MADPTEEVIDAEGGNFAVNGDGCNVTLKVKGKNAIYNEFTVDLFVNLKNETVQTSRPYGAGGHRIAPGTALPIPRHVEAFKVKTAGTQGYFSISNGD